MEGRSSALDTSRNSVSHSGTSRTSSAKGSQLPPLFQHKSNIIDIILSSKGTKLNHRDPSVQARVDFNRMMGGNTEKLVIKRGKLSDTQKLLRVALTRCKKISQTVQMSKGKEDTQLIKHLKSSSCIKIAVDNIYEKMTRKGQIGVDLKGVNNQILEEVDKELIDTIHKESKIFRNEREYTTAKTTLRNSVVDYKRSIMQQIENLRNM